MNLYDLLVAEFRKEKGVELILQPWFDFKMDSPRTDMC